jgi:hypothetical protein
MTLPEFQAAYLRAGTTIYVPGQPPRPHPEGGAQARMGTVGPGGTWATEAEMWDWVYRDMDDEPTT